MGMTIEEAIKYYENKNVVLTEEEALANTLALNTMRKYQQLQAEYENRLKADMLAMLTDFLMDIEENTSINATNSDERNGKRLMRTEIIGMFEQKINSLKENME